MNLFYPKSIIIVNNVDNFLISVNNTSTNFFYSNFSIQKEQYRVNPSFSRSYLKYRNKETIIKYDILRWQLYYFKHQPMINVIIVIEKRDPVIFALMCATARG